MKIKQRQSNCHRLGRLVMMIKGNSTLKVTSKIQLKPSLRCLFVVVLMDVPWLCEMLTRAGDRWRLHSTSAFGPAQISGQLKDTPPLSSVTLSGSTVKENSTISFPKMELVGFKIPESTHKWTWGPGLSLKPHKWWRQEGKGQRLPSTSLPWVT